MPNVNILCKGSQESHCKANYCAHTHSHHLLSWARSKWAHSLKLDPNVLSHKNWYQLNNSNFSALVLKFKIRTVHPVPKLKWWRTRANWCAMCLYFIRTRDSRKKSALLPMSVRKMEGSSPTTLRLLLALVQSLHCVINPTSPLRTGCKLWCSSASLGHNLGTRRCGCSKFWVCYLSFKSVVSLQGS